jgi:sulfide:quinone oxidoreductase
MPPIVILGTGFAGLTAIKTLRKLGYRDAITVISPRPVLFYYPSLIWVPAGLRNEQDLTVPLDKFFKRYQVDYHQATVTGLKVAERKVDTNHGEVAFDSLLIATGARFLKKLPGIEHVYIPCEGYEPTKAYSDRLATLTGGTLAFGFSANPKEPSAMRGGSIFEFLFGVETLLRQQKRRKQFDIVFFNPATQPGKRLGERAVKQLMAQMNQLAIRTHLGHKITGFSAKKIHTEGGDIDSDLTMFMPGMTGPDWITANTGLPLSEGGLLQADTQCRVIGLKGIYVAGDCGSYPGPEWLPKQAHLADLQGETAAKNLLAEKAGKAVEHTFTPELVCILDSLDKGILVYRNMKREVLTPNWRIFNWAKRWFERHYLRSYR